MRLIYISSMAATLVMLVACSSDRISTVTNVGLLANVGDDSFVVAIDAGGRGAVSKWRDDEISFQPWQSFSLSKDEARRIMSRADRLTKASVQLTGPPHQEYNTLLVVRRDGSVSRVMWDEVLIPYWGINMANVHDDLVSCISDWFSLRYTLVCAATMTNTAPASIEAWDQAFADALLASMGRMRSKLIETQQDEEYLSRLHRVE
jgi:hypothetical protein